MCPNIKNITLVWRPGRSHGRIPVAIIEPGGADTTFRYLEDGVRKAEGKGFVCFPEFPDTRKTYTTNVLKVLSQRINDNERSDIKSYYDFWEIPQSAINDTFMLLAYTQGILPTDNFEFLADYGDVSGVRFVSELTGLSINQLSNGTIREGDELEWRLEPDNKFDSDAVTLLKDGTILGHVKRIHCHVFHLSGSDRLRVRVKKIEHNGHISKAFIVIYENIGYSGIK